MPRGPLIIALSVWCVLAGCSDDLALSGYTFACVEDSECGAGWVCNLTKECELADTSIADVDIDDSDVSDTKDVDAPDGNDCTPNDLDWEEDLLWEDVETALQIKEVTPQTLSISWEPALLEEFPECQGQIWYRICVMPTVLYSAASCDERGAVLVTDPNPGLSTTLTGLAPATEYTVSIRGCVDHGPEDEPACGHQTAYAVATTTSDQTVRSMMAAVDHSCAVLVDGSVWCWGSANGYKLGNGQSGAQSVVPQQVQKDNTSTGEKVSYLDQVVKVVGSATFSCALRGDGTVWCWGSLEVPGIADGTVLSQGNASPIDGLVGVVDLTASVATVKPYGHICALTVDGTVSCWGDNLNGQMGIPPAEAAVVLGPTPVPNLKDVSVQQVGAGIYHTCALVDGEVQCWGSTEKGQTGVELGVPPNVTDVTDVTIVGEDGLGITARSLSVGANHTCVIGEADTLYCWGARDYGLFDGVAGTNESPNYTPLEFALEAIEEMSAGFGFNCVRDRKGVLSCWGFNSLGQCGNDLYSELPKKEVPLSAMMAVDLSEDEVVMNVVAGHSHACASTHLGKGYCWGDNQWGQVGTPPKEVEGKPIETTPRLVDGLEGPMGARTIAAAGNVSCALRADGEMRCWGEGDGDSEGYNLTGSALIVTPDIVCVDTSSQVNCNSGFWDDDAMFSEETVAPFLQKPQVKPETLVSNGKYVCALQVGGLALCEGPSDPHKLVSGTPTDRHFVSLTMGAEHVCGLQADNQVFCWGNNDFDQLGSATGDVVNPVNLDGSGGGAIRALQISAYGNGTCAVLVTEGLRCWGNGMEHLSYFVFEDFMDEAVKVVLLEPWVKGGGSDQSGLCVLTVRGVVECYELLGLSSDLTFSYGGDDVPAIDLVAGTAHACMLLADGTVQCWGANDHQQSGCDGSDDDGDGGGMHCAKPTTISLTD